MRNSDLYSIGTMSKMCHVPVKTLRYYDDIGLLPAYQKNTETSYRYYTNEQILKLFHIQNMKALGFSLDEIKEINNPEAKASFEKNIEVKLEDIRQKIQQLKNQQEFLASFSERINSYNVLLDVSKAPQKYSLPMTLEMVPKAQVIFLNQKKSNYINNEINIEARRDLLALAKKANIVPSGPFTATYHNAPLEQFFSNECNYEISAPFIGMGNDLCKTVGGYLALSCIYVGPYQDIIHAHIEMLRWIKDHRYRVVGDISETFLITPIDTGNVDAFVTKIIIPVQTIE